MFYLINKPLGISSFDVIRKLRKILGIKKIGHTGTLDPLATGCLLIATENSTKLIPLLEKLEKTYSFKIRIDGVTPSLDLGTEVIYHAMSELLIHSEEELKKFLENQQSQIPPAYSALRIDGVRAYEKARNGEELEMRERKIQVSNVQIKKFGPPEFEISLRISSGGYIRSFAKSIGNFFGVPGGYITELRRDILHIDGAPLYIETAQSLEDFSPENILPYKKLFPNITWIEINDSIQRKLEQGKIVSKEEIGGNYEIGQKIFMSHNDVIMSLVEYNAAGFQVIRNKI